MASCHAQHGKLPRTARQVATHCNELHVPEHEQNWTRLNQFLLRMSCSSASIFRRNVTARVSVRDFAASLAAAQGSLGDRCKRTQDELFLAVSN
jgi:hypothetical protein